MYITNTNENDNVVPKWSVLLHLQSRKHLKSVFSSLSVGFERSFSSQARVNHLIGPQADLCSCVDLSIYSKLCWVVAGTDKHQRFSFFIFFLAICLLLLFFTLSYCYACYIDKTCLFKLTLIFKSTLILNRATLSSFNLIYIDFF